MAVDVNDREVKGGLAPAAQRPCPGCPWRTENQGKRHPGGWYTKANLRRLWAGMRRGGDMSCHPTDPSNPVPAGSRPAPANATTLECAGSLILKQREIMRFQRLAKENPGQDPFRVYRSRHPHGLTRDGVLAVAERAMFGGIPVVGGRKMTTPDLNQSGVGAPDLTEWDPKTEGTPAADEPRAGR